MSIYVIYVYQYRNNNTFNCTLAIEGWLVGLVRFMVFNATFNNISVILWRSFLVVEETRVPGENHRPAASH